MNCTAFEGKIFQILIAFFFSRLMELSDVSYMNSSTCFGFQFTGKGASFFVAIIPSHYFVKSRRLLLTVEFLRKIYTFIMRKKIS